MPHTQPGFLSRLTGRKLKEDGFTEIHNLLARRQLEQLTAADVETILSNYEISRAQAGPRLQDLYRTAVTYFAADDALSEADQAAMKHLRYVLSLEDCEADEAQNDVLRELYRTRLKGVLDDGFLSDAEKKQLEAIAASFGLPQPLQQAVYKEEVLAVIQQAFNAAVADQRLTDDEEQRLVKMGENLGITITHDADTERKLARFRLLAQVEAGQMLVVSTPLTLQRGEVCHGQLPCQLHEKRVVTKAIRFSGPVARIRIMKGLSWRVGSISLDRVTREEMRQIDSGTLYITNKRLLFNGAGKNFNLPYKKIVKFTAYKDGLEIEKDSGRDQYFIGSGDIELLAAVLETCIGLSRET